LNGDPVGFRSLGPGYNSLGHAYDALKIINNVNNFIIPAGTLVNILGTVKINARRAVIDGKLNGNYGGYPGGRSTIAYGERARSGESPLDTNGHGQGGFSGVSGAGGAGHGELMSSFLQFTLIYGRLTLTLILSQVVKVVWVVLARMVIGFVTIQEFQVEAQARHTMILHL